MLFTGTANDDSILGTANDDTIDGLGGNDTLIGANGDDIIDGGSGDDFLLGGGGNDTLNLGPAGDGSVTFDQARGGTGNDLLIGGSGGPTLLTGGAGNDTLDGTLGNQDEADYFDVGFGLDGGPIQANGDETGVNVNLALGFANDDGEGGTDVLIGIENVVGSFFNDTIIGDDGDNAILAGSGDDVVSGGNGDDNLQGGDGADTLSAGSGSDFLFGGAGADVFVIDSFDAGPDVIADFTITDGDVLDLSLTALGLTDLAAIQAAASDGSGSLEISAGGGTLVLSGVTVADLVTLDANGQIVYGQPLPLTGIIGTANDDLLIGTANDDTINGLAGFDTLRGGNGDDSLNGGADNDTLEGGAGADTLNGGDGTDVASYLTSPEALVVDLTQVVPVISGGDANGDVFISIEEIFGTGFSDSIIADGSITGITTDDGDDFVQTNSPEVQGFFRVDPGDDDDTVIGGDGAEFLRLGPGNDVYQGGNSPGTLGELSGPFGVQELVGDILSTGGEVPATQGAIISLDLGIAFNDGFGDTDILIDIDSLQTIEGNFDNILVGDDRPNFLLAGGGDDTLIGGNGDDTISSGDGSDVIIIDGQSSDIVTELGNTDLIDLSATDIADFDALLAAAEQVGDTVVITFGNGETLTIGGSLIFPSPTLLSDLTPENFTFTRVELAPVSLDLSIDATEQTPFVFSVDDFTFADFNTGDTFASVRIDTAVSGLTLNGVQVTDGQVIDVTDISFGFLEFTAPDDVSTSFTFSVGDNTGLFAASPSTVDIAVEPLDLEGIVGTAGDDLLIGTANDDTINGLGGLDTLIGGNGDDSLNGGADNDTLIGNDGFDTLNGGDGVDAASYVDSPAALNIDLTGVTPIISGGDANGDVFISIENIIGSNFADSIVGDGSITGINSRDGDDFISNNSPEVQGFFHLDPGAGNDTVIGGDGADFLRLGPGDDIYQGGNSPGVLGDLLSGFGVQGLVGDILSTGGDVAATQGAIISLQFGFAANDGFGGQDILFDVDSLQTIEGNFDNILGGDDRPNFLLAGGGNDTLVGGNGDDTISSGDGSDVIVIDGQSSDIITELGATDIVDLSATDIADFDALLAAAEQVGDTVVITFGNGETLTIGGSLIFPSPTLLSDLQPENFTFTRVEIAPVSLDADVDATEAVPFVFSLADFAFGDFNSGDGFASVRIDSAPDGLTLDGTQVTDGQVIDVADIAAGNLVFTAPDGSSTSISFSVGDTTGLFAATPSTIDVAVEPAPVNTVIGTNNDDTLTGTREADEIIGLDGADLISGLGGDDTISGGSGDDTLSGDRANDILNGDDGNDVINGSSGADSLFGGAGFDFLRGDGGNDFLSGGDEADTLFGGNGVDFIDGGNGDDFVFGENGPDTIDGGIGNDTISGGRGADSIFGGDGDDVIAGDAGADLLFGGACSDELIGGNGNDTLFGGNGDDLLNGGRSADILFGGEGSDEIIGENGADTLFGGDGGDTLDGGRGRDVIDGGAGDDTIFGGAGNDTFVFGADSGNDEIVDFSARRDGLDLSGTATDFTDLASVEAASVETTVNGVSGLLIDLGAGNSVFLHDTSLADLSRVDFIF